MRDDPEKQRQEGFSWIGLKIEGYIGVVADTPDGNLVTTFLEKTFICDTEEEALNEACALAMESGKSDLYYWVEYWVPGTQTQTPPRLLIKRKPDVLIADDV